MSVSQGCLSIHVHYNGKSFGTTTNCLDKRGVHFSGSLHFEIPLYIKHVLVEGLTRVSVYMCMYMYMYVTKFVCMCVCVCVCVYVYVYC